MNLGQDFKQMSKFNKLQIKDFGYVFSFGCRICTKQLSTDKCLRNTLNKLIFVDVLRSFCGRIHKVLIVVLKDFNNDSLLKGLGL